ncbi:MAG: hypothetical protein ACLT98_01485 [Eggerthellaceae bacterium]
MMREVMTILPSKKPKTRAILEQGDDVLYLGFSTLFGTYQATALLMEQLSEKYPSAPQPGRSRHQAARHPVHLACKKEGQRSMKWAISSFR